MQKPENDEEEVRLMRNDKDIPETVDRLLDQLRKYEPWNEQEAADRDEIIRQIENSPNIFTRENLNAHMTASSWIVDRSRAKVLMVYHNIYDSWSWTGGHADGRTDLLAVALREAKEETGIVHVHPLSENIYSLEILTVDGHIKRGKYVPSHLHLNLTWLLEADDTDVLTNKADENKAAAWFGLDDAIQASSEPWFRKWIYPKLNEKLKIPK